MLKAKNVIIHQVTYKILTPFCLMVMLLLNSNLHGQIFYHDKPSVISRAKLDSLRLDIYNLIDSLTLVHYRTKKIDIFEINGKTYAIPDGYFDVFLYKNRTWKNLYNGIFGEYNFGSRKFIYYNKIYSYGGYGYWRQNNTIIEFLMENGEWELLKFSETLPFGVAIGVKNGILILSKDEAVQVDLSKGTQKALKEENIPIQWPDKSQYFIENEDWLLCKDSMNLYLASKKSGGQYSLLLKDTPFNQLGITDLIHITNDSLTVYGKSGIRKTFKFELAKENGLKLKPKNNLFYLLLGIVSFMLCIFLLLHYLKNKTKTDVNRKIEVHTKFEGTLISRIMTHCGQTIDTLQLDELLGIQDEANIDTRKYRRAQLIKEINDNYLSVTDNKLIERVRDQQDGRKYIYKIFNI